MSLLDSLTAATTLHHDDRDHFVDEKLGLKLGVVLMDL
jgi:hypothetical protein